MNVIARNVASIAASATVLFACSNAEEALSTQQAGGSSGASAGITSATPTAGGLASTSPAREAGGTANSSSPAQSGNTVIARGGNNSIGATGAGSRSNANAGGTGANGTSLPAGVSDCRKEGDGKTTLVFVNRCTKQVNYRGSDISGGSVAAGAFACVDIGTATEALSSKRYWGWFGADPGAERHSLAEFTFNTDFYDMDWYNISYVDAFNLPLAIIPAARPKCRQLICPQDFLATCPVAGQYRDGDGNLVSCVSPNRDDPKNPVALLFEQCDDAYAWSGDDQNGTDKSPMIGCEVEDFDIVFCPESA